MVVLWAKLLSDIISHLFNIANQILDISHRSRKYLVCRAVLKNWHLDALRSARPFVHVHFLLLLAIYETIVDLIAIKLISFGSAFHFIICLNSFVKSKKVQSISYHYCIQLAYSFRRRRSRARCQPGTSKISRWPFLSGSSSAYFSN